MNKKQLYVLLGAILLVCVIPLDSEWWHFTLKDEPFPDTYFTFPVKHHP
jgi:D-alanyl-D-alanine dipeptidase